jgi:hypothetical protein
LETNDEKTERIVGVKISESTIAGIVDGPPMFFATLEGGEDVPLFQFDHSRINYEPCQFIGMSVIEAYQFKRLQDLIWFGTITI